MPTNELGKTMIREFQKYGKHHGVTIVQFGYGSVDLQPAIPEFNEIHLLLLNGKNTEVGVENSDNIGKTVDDLDRPPIVMTFTSVESVDVFIEVLGVVKKRLLEKKVANEGK